MQYLLLNKDDFGAGKLSVIGTLSTSKPLDKIKTLKHEISPEHYELEKFEITRGGITVAGFFVGRNVSFSIDKVGFCADFIDIEDFSFEHHTANYNKIVVSP